MKNSVLHKTGSSLWVSLIAGMEYGMDRWNGKWNGMVNVHNLCRWRCSSVELASMCLGLLSHCRGYMSKSSACCQHSSLSSIMISQSELGVHEDQFYAQEPRLLVLRKAATKVVRPRSDRGSRCTDKDRSEETEDRALISAIKHIQVSLRRL